MKHEREQMPLPVLRSKMESVAQRIVEQAGGGSWRWDTERLHLDVVDADGEPLFTLHVEYSQ